MSSQNFENWMRSQIKSREEFLEQKRDRFSTFTDTQKMSISEAKLIEESIILVSGQLREYKLILSKYLEDSRV